MSDEAFWAFSLALYERPGVPAACLALQDGFGADVDIVLFTLWCASRGHCLSAAELEAADAAIASWRAIVVHPVRKARKALKPMPPGAFDPALAEALRNQLLAAELAAERIVHHVLEALAPPPGNADPDRTARDNLDGFARWAGIPPGAAPLATLLTAFA